MTSMFPLALGLSIDVYIIARVVFGTVGMGLGCAAVLFAALMVLWLLLPRREGSKNR
jgi:hypothetical protein